jgi:hypothetical protein
MDNKPQTMSNTKPWMTDEMAEEIWDKFGESMLTENGQDTVIGTRNFTALVRHIRDLAAQHYEPLLEAKDAQILDLKKTIGLLDPFRFENIRLIGVVSKLDAENATLKAEVERLKGDAITLSENNKGLMAQLAEKNPQHFYPYLRGRIKEVHKGLNVFEKKFKRAKKDIEEIEPGTPPYLLKSGQITLLTHMIAWARAEIVRLYDIANQEGCKVEMEVESFNSYEELREAKYAVFSMTKTNRRMERVISRTDKALKLAQAELTRLRSSTKDNACKFGEWLYGSGWVYQDHNGIETIYWFNGEEKTTSELYDEWDKNNKL